MPDYDLILRGGTVVTEYATQSLDIGIADGTITALAPNLAGSAATELDLNGCTVMPGAIDAHVHINEPGRTDWEGWATGSRALAAGGTTLPLEMPLNAHPPTLDRASLEAKRAAALASSITDLALWGGLTPANLRTMPDLAESGVVGFKAFMSRSGTDDFPHADDATLLEGMRIAAGLDLPVAVHAENDTITAALAAKSIAAGATSYRDYARSRPAVAETEAISRAIVFAADAGCRLHIVHVSTAKGVALVSDARASGLDVTCETCPHYLLFTDDDLDRIGALAKCAPPLRDAATRDALWDTLRSGEIDLIATDHSPAPPEMKTSENAFEVWGGINGAQHLRTALMTFGADHHLSPNDIVRLTATAVADRFRLPNKGRLAVGYDADIAWGLPSPARTLDRDTIFTRQPASIWDETPFTWRNLGTLVRGVQVYRGGTWLPGPAPRLITPNRD